jgi:hypothetical protein
MNHQFKRILVFVLSLVLLFCATACSRSNETGSAQPDPSNIPSIKGMAISAAEDSKAKECISDFFNRLLTNAEVDSFIDYTSNGTIPDNIRSFISSKTINEGEGNPEISIHLPRFVSINRLVILKYDIVKSAANDDKPIITSDFITKNGDNYVYYSRVSAYAYATHEDEFFKAYERLEDNSYSKIDTDAILPTQKMRVEMKYDIEVENKDGELKIVSVTESNIKPGIKNRLVIQNNESIDRVEYLDLRLAEDDSYINAEDGEIYEAEKAAISTFFSNLTVLDRDRMNLLSHKYNQSMDSIQTFWKDLGITKDSETSKELVMLDANYSKCFPFKSLPLQNNMRSIDSIYNFVVTQHPSYSDTNKIYFVNFDADVQRLNGIVDELFGYKYDYIVYLDADSKDPMITGIRLNEYYNKR